MNHTVITEFVLLGLSDDPELQIVIFLFLLITYVLSVTGNLTIITLTWVDSDLISSSETSLSQKSPLLLCAVDFWGNYYQR